MLLQQKFDYIVIFLYPFSTKIHDSSLHRDNEMFLAKAIQDWRIYRESCKTM